ncbi:anthrax toxin lethal factor-related metalloendopeptidase [Fontibacillus sp. BL9]|uniref:anthrax toxin lethal factor-related metalloendopeptidase n=1 Tax=Fontibacillus sp. BL9 TaxID=3389971 RepID=UPI00397C3B4C
MKRIFYLAIAIIFTMNLAAIPAFAESNNSLVDEIVVLPQGDYSKAEADKMMNRLALIPSSLLQGLKNNGVKIKLVNGKITDEPEFAQYKGVTPRGWENTGLTWDDVPGVSSNVVIARIGYSNKGKGHNGQNLELHETFHAIDRIVLNNVSSSSDFIEVWKQEANNDYEGDGYVSVYSTEYFAETATLYFYSDKTRNHLKEDMPLTYEFLDKLFSSAQ